jgi:Tfp pilus assembly major pilin PilA
MVRREYLSFGTDTMQEFGFGLYDGITGIVTDPYKGAKKEGAVGFVKGVGQGIFSVPFRVMGGAWSVPGYAMKGIYQEMVKSKGKSVQNYIIAARIAQGYDDSNGLATSERDIIVSKWKYVKVGIKKKKNIGEDQMDSLHSLVQDKRKRKQDRWTRVNSHLKGSDTQSATPSTTSDHRNSLSQTPSYSSAASSPGPRTITGQPSWRQPPQVPPRASTAPSHQAELSLEAQLIAEEEAERRELEAAIAASIAHNSHGNTEEDALVANAIRASIAELERTPADAGTADEEAAINRAMQASLEEAGPNNRSQEEQKALEATVRASLHETGRRRQHGSSSEWDSDDDTEDDEEFQRVVAESKELAHLHAKNPEDTINVTGASGASDDDEELRRALEESERAHKDSADLAQRQRTEEDIVLEYVRKQSLLEEEHRVRVMQGRDTGGEGSGAKGV